MRIHRLSMLPFLLLVLALSACAALGLEQPTSFSDRVAYAYSTADGTVQAATNSLKAKTISSGDAEYVSASVKNTRALVTAAETTMGRGDAQGAERRLVLAEGVLKQLQAYVAAKGVKP